MYSGTYLNSVKDILNSFLKCFIEMELFTIKKFLKITFKLIKMSLIYLNMHIFNRILKRYDVYTNIKNISLIHLNISLI